MLTFDTTPVFPLEILDCIFSYALYPISTDFPAEPAKAQDTFPSLSILSKACRTTSLKLWVRNLYVRDPTDIGRLCNMFPSMTCYVRNLYCEPVGAMDDSNELPVWDLSPLQNVRTVQVGWSLSLPGTKETFKFINADKVTTLSLVNHPWVSPDILRECVTQFPHLECLYMDHKFPWCSLCNTCSQVKFSGNLPARIVYGDGSGLPLHYARFLAASNCTSLSTIILTTAVWPDGITTLADTAAGNPDHWSGECNDCMTMLVNDPSFRAKILDRKTGESTEDVEYPYVKVPWLKHMEWRFRSPTFLERLVLSSMFNLAGEIWGEGNNSDEEEEAEE
ncbi:hypothetical protein DL96DRAFT_265483 [Flagelloscypha sp. PMI_526]|nr:hypothetical protein DL96DRAFT_265483 [Flagelloscypha sp. PMI_526]